MQKQFQKQESNIVDTFKDAEDASEEIDLSFYQSILQFCGGCLGFGRAWLPFPFCCVNNPYQRIKQSYAGIIERFGRYCKTVKPGLHYVNPCTEQIFQIDQKTNIIDLESNVVLTRDNITIKMDASVYFRILNPRKGMYILQNPAAAVKYLAFASIRNVCGQQTISIININGMQNNFLNQCQLIKIDVEEHVQQWGIKIDQIFIKDLLLSNDLQNALSSAAQQRRLAESKIISAKADVESAKLMRECADILNSRPAMQIRYLDTIQHIASSPNCKVVFLPESGSKNDNSHKITQSLLT